MIRLVPHRRHTIVGMAFLALVPALLPLEAKSQVPPSAAPPLAGCVQAADVRDRDAMEVVASAALVRADSLEATRPVDALELRARVLSECRIPFAVPIRQGILLEEANELLHEALSLEPGHLGARFALAMNHVHAPGFLGRESQAVQELERLLEDHVDSDDPRLAVAHLRLGELYARTGRADEAVAVWAMGAERFPDFSPLQDRVAVAPETMAYRLEAIEVVAGGYSMNDARSATRLDRTDVYTMPGGTADVLQAFQTMPGMTRVTEGSDLYVRGGDPAETPIWVDGARLFHPGRFETLNGSLFGILDPSVMRRAYFSSGGFSARYGNALSGVVELETDGRPTVARWRAGVNLASLSASVWRPKGDVAGVWASTVLTRTDALLWLNGRSDDYPSAPRSLQVTAGAEAEPRPGLVLRATGLAEEDQTTAWVASHGHEGEFRSRSATRLATLGARLISDDGRGLLRLNVSGSTRDSGSRFGVLDRDRAERSLGARLDGSLERSPLELRGGLEAVRLASELEGVLPGGGGLAPGSPVVRAGEGARAHHLGGYGEAEARVSHRLAVVGGLRLDRLPGEDRWSADPRLAAAYRLEDWTLRVGAGRFGQGRWRIASDVPNGGRPIGVPLRARHLVAGLQRDGAIAVRAEVYHKTYGRYVEGEGGPEAVEGAPEAKGGAASGADVLTQWKGTGPVTGWVTYSFLHAKTELSDGRGVPSTFDVRHTATAVGRAALGPAWEVGLTGRYATGRPFTPIDGAAPSDEGHVGPMYGTVHSRRMPDYVRIDGRLSRFVPVGHGALVAYLEGLNLLDRHNVMTYTYENDYRDRRPVRSFFAERTLVLGFEARF